MREAEAGIREVEDAFCRVAARPRLRFECSMLQTAAEASDGSVS